MRSKPPQTPSRIDRLVRRAGWTMAVERLWPAAVLAAGIVALFVAVSWLGVWPALPRVLRILGVASFAAGLGFAVVRGARNLRVTRAEALRRLDRDSGLPHRPLSTAEDRLANQAGDPTTLALWELSRRRIEGVVRRVRVAPPAPRVAARDPFALRALAALVLVAAAFVAGPHKDGLLASAFDWRSAGAAAEGFRVDAWIDPPGYTGKPPVVLFARDPAGHAGSEITVPAHSTVVVRASGPGALDVRTAGALKAVADAAPVAGGAKAAAPAAQVERRLTLDGNGRLTVLHDGTTLGDVALKAIPDLPPTIVLVGTPKATARGGLTLGYRIDDDYGVTGADASFSDPTLDGHPIAGRSLVPPPKLALDLPPTPGALGPGQTTGDLSDHPWAGAEVTVVLSTKDEGGNVGLSAPVRMTLPARPFNNPLARALVEQRQDLVFDPDHRDGIATALDALMIDPDRFGTSKAVYLGLYTARQRLAAAKTDEDLVALSDYLWQMALKIEDGNLDQTARDLRAAEQALRDALAKGASADEIRTLTEDLRKQMDKFIAELQRKGQQKQARADRNSKVISQHDLEKMMKRMEEMAQSGQASEAQRMLDELQNMLDNLQMADGSPSDQADREMNKQMSELDRMTRDQQGLRDRTFKKGQRSRSPDGSPSDPQDDQDDDAANDASRDATPQPGDQADDLEGQQQALRQRLDQLQKSMRQLGMKGEQGLDDAGEAMKDAEGALGQGPGGNRRAVEAQGRALAGLQKGASGLAEQMAQGQSDQTGEGQGRGGQVGQGSSGDSENDPLGRKRESRGTMETQGNALDEGVAARAQRVLQELRRRLGDPNRPTEEMDYLERLLRRN